jgi:hypothetical protein
VAQGVLGNDDDHEADPLIAVVVDTVDHGTLVLYPNGSFRYEPDPGFAGRDRFTYRVSDGEGLSLPTTVEIGVGNTPVGTDVVVDAGGGVVLRFAKVVIGGHTTVAPAPAPVAPEGFLPGAAGPARVVHSTASHSGPVLVSMTYDPTGLAGSESDLRLLHRPRAGHPDRYRPPGVLTQPDAPGNVTVAPGPAGGRISGEVLTPSLFHLVVPAPSGGALPAVVLALLAVAALLALLWLVRLRASAAG